MAEILKLYNEEQLCGTIKWAASAKEPLEVIGGYSKPGLGRPISTNYRLDLSGFTKIDSYQPEELVLSLGAGVTLVEIRTLLKRNRQELAFEPPDYSSLMGTSTKTATIGGVISCNLSGPRRIKAGAARDHILGIRGISGRGEIFKSGGTVVKNVTGYDLSKLLAGSYGTLSAITNLCVRVLPAAETISTLLLFGLNDSDAIDTLGYTARTPCEPSGLAHLPRELALHCNVSDAATPSNSVTAIRIEGPPESVTDRIHALQKIYSHFHTTLLCEESSRTFWQEIRDVIPFSRMLNRVVWRLSVPPSAGAKVVAEIKHHISCEAFYDWGGGLIWLALDPKLTAESNRIRNTLKKYGGHALLVRARADIRRQTSVFQPQSLALHALSTRIKDSFDPLRILNPGKMFKDI